MLITMQIYSLAILATVVAAEENLVRVKRQFTGGFGNRLPTDINTWFNNDNAAEDLIAPADDEESNDSSTDVSTTSDNNQNSAESNNGDSFTCIFRDEYGFEYEWSHLETAEECHAEKAAVFEAECEADCGDDEDSLWPCDAEGIANCVNAQFMAGRAGRGPTKRQLGMKYGRWKAAARMIGHIVAKPNLKKKTVIKRMLNYGCHCFPGGKKTRTVGGKGPAMDEIDNVCRTQFQCHKCVELDTGCDPDTTAYKAQFRGGKKALVKQVVCKDPENSCKRQMCECDKRMAENLKKVWFKPDAYNLYHWNEKRNQKRNPTFDYKATCLVPGNSPQPDQCCGVFPDVIPYNQATKSCCVEEFTGKLFNPMTHTCCAGGLIATFGSC